MFSNPLLILCVVPFIAGELNRQNVNITSLPLIGGIIPSNSVSLNTVAGTKLTSKGEVKSQNVTLKTPIIALSVKNATLTSPDDMEAKITNTLANVVDKSNHDLLPRPENVINPEDIMLDLNIPVRVTELEDLTKATSFEEFKQKIQQSSLVDQIFSSIEEKAKYYSALENLASNIQPKMRRKREAVLEEVNDERENQRNYTSSELLLQPSRGTVHRIFYHYPKKVNSEIVYRPGEMRTKFRRSADSDLFFSPASTVRNEMVGAFHPIVHHPLHHIPPPLPVLPPPLPRHPIPHLPLLPVLPPLPIIPPEIVAEFLRSLARHPLPLLHIPPPIAPHYVLERSRSASADIKDTFASQIPHSEFMGENIKHLFYQLSKFSNQPGHPILRMSINPYEYLSDVNPQNIIRSYFEIPRQIFQRSSQLMFGPMQSHQIYIPISSQISDRQRSTSQPVYHSYNFIDSAIPNRQKQLDVHQAPGHSLHQVLPHHLHSAETPIHQTLLKAPSRNEAEENRGEVLESLEHTGQLFGNALFSLLGHMPSMT